MNDGSFTTAFTVDRTPAEAFAAITDVRGWWSGEIEGNTDRLGAEFSYRHQDLHRSTQRIVEFVADQLLVWLVVDAHLGFVEDSAEWTGTRISFELSEQDGQTEVRFTHRGLVPDFECFDACSNAWGFYVNGSLRNLIVAGRASVVEPLTLQAVMTANPEDLDLD